MGRHVSPREPHLATGVLELTADYLQRAKVGGKPLSQFGALVEMLLELTQLSGPLTPPGLVRAADAQLVQRPLEPEVWEDGEVLPGARRAWLLVGPNVLYAGSAEGVPAAGGLVGLAKYQEADWTVRLDGFRRSIDKLAVEAKQLALSSRL